MIELTVADYCPLIDEHYLNNYKTHTTMAIEVGCFALVSPFASLEKQLEEIKRMGFSCADVTDRSDGACLGVEYGFTALASLDGNPHELKRLFDSKGLTISSVCAHANLLDPSSPSRFGTSQIIKAVKLAAAIGVKHVITAEGDPKTAFGENLSVDEAIFSIVEKLYEPLRIAEDYGVKILLEPHGKVTDSVDLMEKVIEKCNSEALGINLDTGNLWIGGGDPLEMIERLGDKIEHVHWKDIPEEMQHLRGTVFGCGMTTIPLGTGMVDIESIYEALVNKDFSGYTTLEIAGTEAVLQSRDYLKSLEEKYALVVK